MTSLRLKIILSTLSIIFVIIVGSYILIQDIQKGILEGDFREKGFLLAQHTVTESTDPLQKNDLMTIKNYIDNLKSTFPELEYIYLTDPEGQVLVHTSKEGLPEVPKNLSNPANTANTHNESIINTEKGIIHEFDAPLYNNIGYVHIGLSENIVRKRILEASRKLFLLDTFGIFLGGIFAFFIGRRLTEPVLKLTEGAKLINKGKLDQKIEIKTNDELGELAMTFNDMASSLNQKISALLSSKEEILLRNRELTVLNDISKNINETFDLGKILSNTLGNILKFTGMENGEIYLLDEKSEKYLLRMHQGGNLQPDAREVLTAGDVQRIIDSKTGINGKSISIPLRSKDKLLGLITIRSDESHLISGMDKELYNAIGNQIGVAIENVLFYENIKYLNEFNEEILNNINQAIHVVDKDMNIIALNNELIKLSRGKLKRDYLINRNLYEVFPFLKQNYVDKEYEYVIETGEIFQSEEKTKYYGDVIYTSTSKVPIKDKNGNVEKIITVMKDVSEQKRLEEELKDSYEEMQLTYSKLKELYKIKDNFLSNMSHELRTPLTNIMGYSELILSEKLSAGQRYKFEVILRNSKRLSNLLDMLLDTTLIESNDLSLDNQILSVHDIVSQVIEDMKITASIKNIPIYPDVPKSLIIEGDKKRLIQVFSNLIENAIKFTLKGNIRIMASLEKEDIHITISDTGIGIPVDKLDLIFDRFYQSDPSISRKYGGTGLGLWLSRKIIEAHGGKIWAESKNTGSTFHILLPKWRLNE
ncbi:MAG: PAS domain-containing protein [Candidatus Methanoperedens sp.]|nr:PAS domain-containing protein [Candidatus Methanoperedens sp.]MCE8424548.1 PAS domain-containing protein [Candidatus Methanoperedens sp.]MCE8427984.1 PAS domain-containing protein [Candidatus Methanoperedens sp.]